MYYNSLLSGVSKIGMGCWAMANDQQWGTVDENELIATVHMALDIGINFFDTSENYGNGHSEEVLGRALSGRRQKAIVSTKVSGSNLLEKELPKALELSLNRLKTDYIDLYYIHWPNREIPFEETMTALNKLKLQGKIRAIGVSNFGERDLSEIVKFGRIDVNQLPYNLFWRMIENAIVEKCISENTGIVCYSPLAQGLLTGKFRKLEDIPASGVRLRTRLYKKESLELVFQILNEIEKISAETSVTIGQVSLAWLLSQPGVVSAIPGAKTRKQLTENVKALAVVLRSDQIMRLTHTSEQLKKYLGTDPDMWDKERYR
ncbi:MAG: aldo/keto reductase [Elusimicrobia bacterium CG_4_10_14_0_8_um_filter_37_32]|nr:MAG: aldo/keto reductase [Elusimicrobia bacterium CG_4_10_14_0_8_um_filter_37_32]